MFEKGKISIALPFLGGWAPPTDIPAGRYARYDIGYANIFGNFCVFTPLLIAVGSYFFAGTVSPWINEVLNETVIQKERERISQQQSFS